MKQAFLGVDIGTSSSKGVLVDRAGCVLALATREHRVDRPRPGHVEMDGAVWWDDFRAIARELVASGEAEVTAVGVSGMGPCVLLADEHDQPVRPAILYGVDTRSGKQQDECDRLFGAEHILQRCGSAMSSQAAAPKIAWIRDVEPAAYQRARRLFMPSSWLVRKLTGAYVLDHHSASQSTPLYDVHEHTWINEWAEVIAPGIELPPLQWAGDTAGHVTAAAAAETMLPEGIPVITGTIDAWAEAISVDAHNPGDLMLMYGTTMFLINTLTEPARLPALWGPVGAYPGRYCLAGGMATSGAITAWLRELYGAADFPELAAEAARVPPGADGLLMLPYFAGERTPLMDPSARGVIAGLTLSHTRAHIYRAALEATAFGVRHNLETMLAAGAQVRRVIAVGGGATTSLWPQIVTDVTGVEQLIPQQTVGASYGAAYLAARQVADVRIGAWNPPRTVCRPRPQPRATYDHRYRLYRDLYTKTRDIVHALATPAAE